MITVVSALPYHMSKRRTIKFQPLFQQLRPHFDIERYTVYWGSDILYHSIAMTFRRRALNRLRSNVIQGRQPPA